MPSISLFMYKHKQLLYSPRPPYIPIIPTSSYTKRMAELYDLVPENKDWVSTKSKIRNPGVLSEDKKLELRLGPPGEDQSLLSHQACNNNNNNNHEAKRVFQEAFQPQEEEKRINWLMSKEKGADSKCQNLSSYSENMTVEKVGSAQWSYTSLPSLTLQRETQWHQQQPKRSSPPSTASKFPNSAAPSCSQKRVARAPAVVGWPPVRSFRKNLGSSSFSKSTPLIDDESPKTMEGNNDGKREGSEHEHRFVKINMEGVPIGRKVDLKAYDSYQKLSYAIDELFRGLLAAQRDYSACEKENKSGSDSDSKQIRDNNSLQENGEYTLVYEDNEGDKMLVGDVPWQMFVSTAKRLRVLKSSEISTLRLGSSEHEKTPLDATMEIEIGR